MDRGPSGIVNEAVSHRSPVIDRRPLSPEGRDDGGRLTFVAIALAVALSFAPALYLLSVSDDQQQSPPIRAETSYTAHAAISINGNAQFNNTLYPSNGVVSGNGTAIDPYIIEGWEINTTGIGIFIRSTTDHFIIRDCLVRSLDTWSTGVRLDSVRNAVLEGNNCSGHGYGIMLYSSSHILVANNTCDRSYAGIASVNPSDNNTVAENSCNSCTGNGIQLIQASNSSIVRNNCSSGNYGIMLSAASNCTVTDNTCRLNTGMGVLLDGSGNCTVAENVLDSNQYGAIISQSPLNTVMNNSCTGGQNGVIVTNSASVTVVDNVCASNQYGVLLSNSPWGVVALNDCSDTAQMGIQVTSSGNVTVVSNACSDAVLFGIYLASSNDAVVEDNTCMYNDLSGVYLGGSHYNHLANNTLSENTHGVYLWSSNSNEIQLNDIENQTSWGVRIEGGSANVIWNNTFTGNNGVGGQACDNGTGNRWNISGSPHGYGNYWSDWTSPDDDMDGVVDDPYLIYGTGGASDHYPLTTSPTVPIPEFGSFPVVVLVMLLVVLLAGVAGRRRRD